jgi:anti-sigma factor RsiW
MSEFRFGNVSGPVNAGSGNMNVGSGSQAVAGGDLHIGDRVGADPEMAGEIASMRQQLADLRLTASERAAAEVHLDAVESSTDKKTAAGHLESLVSGVKKADAIASAGSSFIQSAAKIAKWLGPVAVGVLSLL